MIGQRVREMIVEETLVLSEFVERTKGAESYLSNIKLNISTNPTIYVI